jgi:hypothetical protein
MRNIIGQKDFINKYKNVVSIYETADPGMDFSNRTGWSQSLVGRALNKTFSFISKKAYMLVLNSLKKRLDDEYMRALLKTLKQ